MIDIKYIKSLAESIVNKRSKNEVSEAIKIMENISVDSNKLKELVVLHKLKSLFMEQSISIETALKKENMLALNYFSDFDFSKNEKEFITCQEMISKSMSAFSFLRPISVINAIDSIYDGFNEFSRMKFSSYPNNTGDLVHVDLFIDEKMSAYSHYDALLQLKDKPYGYYLFDINSNISGSFTTKFGRTEKHIVSHQRGGMFVAELYFKEIMSNYAGHPSKYETPYFEANRSRNIEGDIYSEEVSLISNKNSLFYSHNQKILLGISFMCSLIHSKRKEIFSLSPQKNLITFGGGTASDSKEVIALNHSSHHINDFTLEDLKFTGDFESLSILDELFSEMLQKHIHLINFKRDDSDNKVYVLWSGKEKDIEKPFIKELEAHEQVSGYSGNNPILKSIPSLSLFGNEKEGKEKLKQFAIQNKISLIRFYSQYMLNKLDAEVTSEIQNIALEKADWLVDIVKSQIESGEVLSVSGAKWRWLNMFASDTVVLISESVEKLKKLKPDEPVVVRNYLGKSNASNIIYFEIKSVNNLLSLFGKQDISELPKNANLIAKLMNISEQMAIYSKKNNMEMMMMSNIDYSKTRPEMTLYDFNHRFEFALPVSKKELKELIPKGIYREKW